MNTPLVKQECPSCKGSGIEQPKGFAPEEAVVCLVCAGKGWRALVYTPFAGRRPKPGIKVVRRHLAGAAPSDVARTGHVMTYADFERLFPCGEPDGAAR